MSLVKALPLAISAVVFGLVKVFAALSFLVLVIGSLFFGVILSLYMVFVTKEPMMFKAAIDLTLLLLLLFGVARTAVAAHRIRNTGSIWHLEGRLERAAASPSAGTSIVNESLSGWKPLLLPVGWGFLASSAGDEAGFSRCTTHMLVYAASFAITLCGPFSPLSFGLQLVYALGHLHLWWEHDVLHRERLLKLVDEAERAGEAEAHKLDNERRIKEEEEEEQRKRAQELASFDAMLEARWWSGRAAPGEWSVADVVEWLLKEDISEECTDAFVSNHITGEVLLELSDYDLRDHLKIHSFGLRRRLLSRIEELRVKANALRYNARL